MPWRRRADDEVKSVLEDTNQRLFEYEELRRRADDTGERLRRHLQRNRFGALIEREMLGGR